MRDHHGFSDEHKARLRQLRYKEIPEGTWRHKYDGATAVVSSEWGANGIEFVGWIEFGGKNTPRGYYDSPIEVAKILREVLHQRAEILSEVSFTGESQS